MAGRALSALASARHRETGWLGAAAEDHRVAHLPVLRLACWCTGDERGGGDEAARKRKLREAQRLFTEMGTTARAAQVARELSA